MIGKRMVEGVFWFKFAPTKSQFAVQFQGEDRRFFPISYTYRECAEDWCHRRGYEFHQMLVQYGFSGGSGHFEYYRHIG